MNGLAAIAGNRSARKISAPLKRQVKPVMMSRGDHLAGGGVAKARFHDMRHQRLDFDDVAALGLLGDVDECGGHHITSSVQAANVTTTSALTDHNESSESRAIAMIF